MYLYIRINSQIYYIQIILEALEIIAVCRTAEDNLSITWMSLINVFLVNLKFAQICTKCFNISDMTCTFSW